MQIMKKGSILLMTTFLLAACGGTLEQGAETDSVVESQSEIIESIESSEEVVSSEVEVSEVESDTQMNEDEAALIERALTTIASVTGYTEEEGYMHIIHPVEGDVVTVEIREDNEEVANMVGMFKYDDVTENVQEMDMLTGEYVDFPAE
ncbi:hypothetical protein ACTQ5F_01710 [Jeotgalibaca porci]|uniref:hypothetical protein n=1 Tax=Jeotgalibaca porci TaxID=1868793 RepID=UPI003F90C1D0